MDVVVAVPVGQTDRQATDNALSQQGASRRAKPPWAGGGAGGGGGGGGGGEQYFYTGLKWSPPFVTQNYNPAGQPLDAKAALTNTYSDWSNLPDSAYEIAYGADTTRCPSLVQQCPGAQVNDPYNDVGWLVLGGTTLGVTWYTTGSDPEADMALNTRFRGRTHGSNGNGYDVETVFLHENGHVAGLDHANRTDFRDVSELPDSALHALRLRQALDREPLPAAGTRSVPPSGSPPAPSQADHRRWPPRAAPRGTHARACGLFACRGASRPGRDQTVQRPKAARSDSALHGKRQRARLGPSFRCQANQQRARSGSRWSGRRVRPFRYRNGAIAPRRTPRLGSLGLRTQMRADRRGTVDDQRRVVERVDRQL